MAHRDFRAEGAAPMKLLYITDVFPPHCGGSGWSVYFFARGLRELGHQVDIISLDGSPREYDGFEVRTFPLKRSHAPFFASWDREKRQLPLLAQKIKAAAGSYDLIHAHHKVSALGTAIAQPERWFATIRDYWPICICGRSLYRTGAV
jgi:glycosyltransferase involved in cell wall biosynthesis